MKILIIGGTGMLGHRLWLELGKNHEVIATVRNKPQKIDRPCIEGIDVRNYDQIEKTIFEVRPDAVINCVGIIKQLNPADNMIDSIQINSLLPHQLARTCADIGARFVHFSTDCVFDGSQGLSRDDDISNAKDLYGRSKFLGEVSVMKNVFTFRSSIIGRELNRSQSLVDWFISQNNGSVKGFKHAIYTGFPTKTVAKILNEYILPNTELNGVYNVASPPISKYDLLVLVKKVFDLNIEINEETEFKMDRSLNGERFNKDAGFTPDSWETLVKDLRVDDDLYQPIS